MTEKSGMADIDTALQILKDYFPKSTYPDAKITKDDAFLLASKVSVWGGLLETQNTELAAILKKFPSDIEITEMVSNAPYWASTKLKSIQEDLQKIRNTPRLIGRQNTSNFEIKVILVNSCRQIWIDKTRIITKDENGQEKFIYTEPPYPYQQESHPFTGFVTEVINLHRLCFSARSAIEAFDKYLP